MPDTNLYSYFLKIGQFHQHGLRCEQGIEMNPEIKDQRPYFTTIQSMEEVE